MIPIQKKKKVNNCFLIHSIIWFIMLYLLIWMSICSLQIQFIAATIFCFLITVLIKSLVWKILSVAMPNIFNPHFIYYIGYIFLIDFKQAYQLDRLPVQAIKNQMRYILSQSNIFYNILGFYLLFYILTTPNGILFDFLSEELYKNILFTIFMVLSVCLIINNMEIINYFKFNQEIYRLSINKEILSFIYLFSAFYAKLYIMINIMFKESIVGLVYFLGVKIIIYIIMTALISRNNAFSTVRAKLVHPQLTLDKIRSITSRLLLLIYLFFNDVDISPIYSFYQAIYDRMVDHYAFICIRLISIIEVSVLINYLHIGYKQFLQDSSFYYISLAFVGIYLIFNAIYLIFKIASICYPRMIEINLTNYSQQPNLSDNINSPLIASENNQIREYIEYHMKLVKRNFMLNHIYYSTESSVLNNKERDALEQTIKYILFFQTERNIRIEYGKNQLASFTPNSIYIVVTDQNTDLVEMILTQKIYSQRECTFVFMKFVRYSQTVQFTEYLIEHIFQLDKITVKSNQEYESVKLFLKDIQNFYSQKYSNMIQITAYHKILSHYLPYNPVHNLYDLYKIDED